MNERMNELHVMAARYAKEKYPSDIVEWAMCMSEKFAELIVQECANRVNGMVVMDKGHIPQDPHSQGWNSAVAYAGKELKKHFGVE
jgi:hypothetical protein